MKFFATLLIESWSLLPLFESKLTLMICLTTRIWWMSSCGISKARLQEASQLQPGPWAHSRWEP